MKHLIVLLLLLSAFPRVSSAQKIEHINSGEQIKRAVMLYDSGEYKKALPLYDKINRSDTNYVWSLYEKALTCEADSQFNQAIKYCQEGLARSEQREYEPDLYNTYGNSLSDQGKPEEAIKIFDEAIAKYPAYSLLYFNKGIALLALNKPHDAELWLQKSLLINPYMYSAHYQLGVATLKQGKIIPAFLSFLGYLLVNPEGRYGAKSISLLNQISKTTDDILELKNKRTETPDDNYQAVEDIVLSKIALDRAYKPIIALDDPISRQIQAVFEKLEYKETDSDFWIQYYLPYFKQVFNDGKFELFINHAFSNVKVDAIQEYNKKNKKALEAFSGNAADYFNLLRATRELRYKNRDSITKRYYFENGKFIGTGVLINNGKTLIGNWNFNYPAGNVKSKGNYNAAGQREGEFLYYYFTGILKAKEYYKGGKLDGEQYYYFENGNPSSVEKYTNGQPDGLINTYYYAGAKKSIINYKAGKKEGEERKFFSNGNLMEVNNYVNGLVTGDSREYYKYGGIKAIEQYSNGKAEGSYKSYHENGTLSVEGNYSKDNGQGEWKYYYESGKLKEKRNYINDQEEGVHEEYFENGQIATTYAAKKGKATGDVVAYYEDGKLLSKYGYDGGVVKSAKYFDKAGTELSSSESKNNQISIVSYSIDGSKKAHFGYDQKGVLNGPDTLFYPSGKISQINEYKNGEFNGPSVSYYLNGNKKSEVNMTDGKNDGHYLGFYVNGKPEAEGWLQDGQNQGEWDYFDEYGRLSSKYFYLDDDIDGYKVDYLPNGKKISEQKYHRGWLEEMTQYDTTGKVLATDLFSKASGKYTLLYSNGKVKAQGNYIKGDFDGPYKTYYFDGSLESSAFYNNGLKDSTYASFNYGGSKNTEGKYKLGDKTGIWKAYEEDGKLFSTTTYENNAMNGDKTYYFKNGDKDLVSAYKNDVLDGLVKKYDPTGALAYQVVFDSNYAKAYTYLGKDGKLLPLIPIANVNEVLKTYFPNGKLSREFNYNNGKRHGQETLYYSSGQLRTIDNYSYGISEGAYKEYYENGKPKSEYYYLTDNANGICKEFDEKGILKKEMVFENGLNHGPVKYYDANGKLIKTMWYNYGTLTSVTNEK